MVSRNKIALSLIRVIAFISITLFFVNCENVPHKMIADQYVEIVTDSTKNIEIQTEELGKIISDYDKVYLSKLSRIYTSRDEKLWYEYLIDSPYKELECSFFSIGLSRSISDSTVFSKHVLGQIINIEKGRFNEAEYIRRKRITDSWHQIIYGVPVPNSNKIQEISVNTHTEEGESTVVLDMQLAKITGSWREYDRMREKMYPELREDLVGKLILRLRSI